MTWRLWCLDLCWASCHERFAWYQSAKRFPLISRHLTHDSGVSSQVDPIPQLHTKLEPRIWCTSPCLTKDFLSSKRSIDGVKMHSPSTSPQRVETHTPTSPENISIRSDMVGNSVNSKDETAKPATLGSYAVGFDLLMDPALSIAYTPSREFYHMVLLMGVFIL